MSERPDFEGIRKRLHESMSVPEYDYSGAFEHLCKLRCDLAELLVYAEDLIHDHPPR